MEPLQASGAVQVLVNLIDNLSYASFEAIQVDKYYQSEKEKRHIEFPEAYRIFKESGRFNAWNEKRERQFAERQKQEVYAMTKKLHPEVAEYISKGEHLLNREELDRLFAAVNDAANVCIEQKLLAEKHRNKKDHNPVPHGIHLVNGIAKKTISGEYWAKLLQQRDSEIYVSLDENRIVLPEYQFRLEDSLYVDGKSELDMHLLAPLEGDKLKILAYGHDKHKVEETLEELLR